MDGVIRSERFTLRAVTPEDHAALLDVYRQCEDFLALGPNPTASAEMIAGDLALSQGQGGIFYGVYDPAGQMIGVVDVVPRLYEGDPALAFLELLRSGDRARSRGGGQSGRHGQGDQGGRAGEQSRRDPLLAAHGLPHHRRTDP
jgi:hypothetical protein